MQQQQQEIRLDLNQTSKTVCPKCDNETFQEMLLLRKWSRLVSGLPNDQYVPVSVFVCTECGTAHQDSMPPQLKALLDKENEE
jgi:uncharacterized Zn finger protein